MPRKEPRRVLSLVGVVSAAAVVAGAADGDEETGTGGDCKIERIYERRAQSAWGEAGREGE